MAKQYSVGEFFVDLSRNQISQLSQSQTLSPKVLLVLTLFAKNRGKVVSYNELLLTLVIATKKAAIEVPLLD